MNSIRTKSRNSASRGPPDGGAGLENGTEAVLKNNKRDHPTTATNRPSRVEFRARGVRGCRGLCVAVRGAAAPTSRSLLEGGGGKGKGGEGGEGRGGREGGEGRGGREGGKGVGTKGRGKGEERGKGGRGKEGAGGCCLCSQEGRKKLLPN